MVGRQLLENALEEFFSCLDFSEVAIGDEAGDGSSVLGRGGCSSVIGGGCGSSVCEGEPSSMTYLKDIHRGYNTTLIYILVQDV